MANRVFRSAREDARTISDRAVTGALLPCTAVFVGTTLTQATAVSGGRLALLGDRDPASVVHHCGSGVSAVPNVLAMEIAGLGHTALFAGSWSEWCSDPSRPVAQG